MESIEKILIRTPKRLKLLVWEESRKLGISANALILQILWDWAEKQKEVRP